MPARQKQVFRLDVPMHDPLAVSVIQRISDLRRDLKRIVEG